MVFLLKSLILSQIVFADTGVRCDFESLTKNCQLFSENGEPKIMMPDGKTFLPNYSYLLKAQKDGAKAREKAGQAFQKQFSDQEMQEEFAVAEIFDQIPSSKMSAQFKFQFIQKAFLFAALSAAFGESEPDLKFNMFWPPESPSPKLQSIDVTTFHKEFEKILSEDQMTKLSGILESYKRNQKLATDWNAQNVNPMASETNAMTPERKQRISELIKLARESVIHSIVGDAPETDWTSAEAAAVAKVKKVDYVQGDDPQISRTKGCQGLVANAFYVPQSHSILVCPNIYSFPDATLVSILTHEMGHSVDACYSQVPVYHIDIKKFFDEDGKAEPPENIKNDKDLLTIWNVLLQAPKTKKHLFAENLESVLENPKKIDEFMALGYMTRVTPTPPPATQDHDQISGYVLSDVYNCLVSKEGGAFRQTTDAELESVADIVVAQRRSVADENYDPKKDKERIIRAYKRFPQCNSPRAESQMLESMADWYGSRGAADFAKKEPVHSSVERLAPVGFFADVVCLNRAGLTQPKTEASDGSVIVGTTNALTSLDDSHPQDKSRIERIFLSNSDLRKAMGCEPSVYKSCQHFRSKDTQSTQSGVVR